MLAIAHPGTRPSPILGSRPPARRRRAALGDLLRRRREALAPDAAGIATAGRRRTPGLRREEVAQLAGVSAAWYTWLEQGRDIQPSSEVLAALARALRLSDEERAHAFALAGRPLHDVPPPPPSAAPPLVQAVLDALTVPAYVSDRAWNVIGWNAIADQLLGYRGRAERNTIVNVFAEPAFRTLFPSWHDEAAQLVASLRRAADEAPEDPVFEALIERLNGYPDFRRLWARHDVKRRGATRKELRHPTYGTLVFTTQAFATDELRLVIFLPDPDTARVLRRVARVRRR
ncbi:MAG TPA: helix-turn-helix transcriptional regulator [Kofleriaceae bacterium]|jgi:transcriptional regulator with XRE-family HTH domain|nr:helix-turn-helix transcriptional regulator [Kofleriaceae bacterium]